MVLTVKGKGDRMDPNKAWDEIVELLKKRHWCYFHEDTESLSEKAEDLFQWVDTGGFLPEQLESIGLNVEAVRTLLHFIRTGAAK